MNTNGHYIVEENTAHQYAVSRESIRFLRCRYCSFTVYPRTYRKSGDRSGLPRYARARGEMVKHLHAEHRSMLAGKEEGKCRE